MIKNQPKAPVEGGLDTSRLLNLMSDINGQPDWRSLANRACAYYDNDQLPASVKRVLEERGQPLTIHNLIAPTIDGVLGMEAKSRTDLMVIADDHDDELEQIAEAVNAEYADMCRLGGLDRARGEAYAGQIKTGLGWVEVRRQDDPFGPRYKFSNIHRDEVYWDWHSREPDLTDCRWLMRRRWVDVDEAKTLFPSKAEALTRGINNWDGIVNLTSIEGMAPNLVSAFDEWSSFDSKQVEWCSRERDRVLLQVVYYRTFTTRQVLMLDSGRALEYDKTNQLHLAAVATGRARLDRRPVAVIRESWFVGPHHLVDRPCSAPHNMYPLVPFWGYRKDSSGEPYGLIARAIPAQDEVNLRRIKLTFLLQAKRVIMDKDATNMTRDQVLEQVERPDGLVELNPDRQNKTSVSDAFKVEQDFNVAAQQFQVMQDSVKLIQDTMGVYAAFLGQGTTGQSGVAISNLVEQGATTLSEINDNYRMGCQLVGQLALSYLLEELAAKKNYKVTVNRDDPRRRKAVVINVEQEDGKLSNDVTRLRAHIALAPIQQTAAYKQQLAERMTQAMAQLPPEAAAACFDLLVELMDVPRKAEFVERIRNALNIPKDPEEMDEEERAAAEQQAQQQQMEQEMAMREMQAHLAELEQSAWGRGWDRVVAWVTKALRSVGFVPDGITAAETRTLIEGLGKKMKRPYASRIGADGDGLWFSAERSPWKEGFPEVILHGRLGDATSHPDYEAAKGGDDAAARRLVREVLSPDAIRQLKEVIGNREAIALGVHAEEAVSRNAIPQAMADLLGKVLGIEVSVDIVQAAKVGRTSQDGFGRLALQPGFDGKVRTDKPYLIMDDTLTQGGTLANLKGYIENRGGEVLAATALTGKQYSAKIAIDSSTLEQLREQYDGTGLEAWWQNRFGYGFDSLTESEGRYILRAKDADKVRDRVAAAGHAAPARGEHESPRDDGSLPPDGLKFSQTNTVADKAMEKLNLGPKPDIIDTTKANLAKLRSVDRGMVQSWVDRVIKKANTEVLDALAPIKYAEQAAGITDAADSGYIAARMATGAASTMQATMLYGLPEWKDGVIQRKAGTGEKDALLGIFSDLGTDLHNWLGWMAGHRAEILLGQGRENLLDANDIAALKGLGKGKEAKFMDAKVRWNSLNAATLDLAQEAGLFTAEARAEFESEWYIPFFRESEDGDVIAPFKPKGIANQNAGIKKLKGGEANTNDLLENIFTSTSKLIDASMKNMAAQKTVWNLADTGLIEVVAKPNMMDWRALKNGKDLITVKLDGEDYMIRVEDPDLYRAMTFFDRQPFGTLVNVAAKAKRLLTAGVTASPEFMLRNFLRDSLSSWVISKDGFKPVIDSIKGVRKTLAMDGSTIDVMFSGASFLGGYVNGNDPTAMADTVRKSLRRKGMTPEQIARYEKSIIRNAAHAKGVVADVWEKYNRLGEGLENANREAVYDAAIKAGKSHAQAAFESKDLMDFSMLGAARAIQGAAMVLPFFNARLQGLGKLTRELRDNPREIAKRAGMITAMSLGLLAANWDDERYEELPDWDKDTNWHFFLGDQHFRIPKPFEIGVMFGTIPERMVRALGDKDTGAQFGKAIARAIGDTFALNPTPQLVKPMVEAAFNYDSFRGGPIDGPQDLAVRAEARYNEQTSLLMRELGELSGFSPKQLEHLLIGYTGTMGSYVMAAADGLIQAVRPGESASWRADEIPLVKAVYRGTGPAKSTQHMEDFYRMLNEVNQLKRTVDQYRGEGEDDKADELLEEQGGILKARRHLSLTQQQIRVLRSHIELLQRDRTLSAEEKRQRIDRLLASRNTLVYNTVRQNRGYWE